MVLSVLAFFAIASSEVGIGYSGLSCPDNVSFTGFVLLSAPSPCKRLSRLSEYYEQI